MELRVSDVGISSVYRPKHGDPIVDILFVHGFDGHPFKTWAKDSPKGLAPCFWPADLLPRDCPDAQILVYGYDRGISQFPTKDVDRSDIFSHANDRLFSMSRPGTDSGKYTVYSHGKDLLSSLSRSRDSNRPLIFVAHGLGGLIVKEMLTRSDASSESGLRNILDSTVAVIFLGTPHRVPDSRNASIRNIDLQPTNLTRIQAERLQETFSTIWMKQGFRVKTFQEGLVILGLGNKVVTDYSSLLGNQLERAEILNADYSDMCRFADANDPNYRKIASEILSIFRPLTKAREEDNEDPLSKAEKTYLGCLRFPLMNVHLDDMAPPAKDTCLWLFSNQLYQNWLLDVGQERYNGLLWLTGFPGSGKSILMKEAFRRAELEQGKSGHSVAGFFFNGRGDHLERSPVGLLRLLLYQLLAKDRWNLHRFHEAFASKARDDSDIFSEQILSASLVSMFTRPSAKRTIIYIDALDECESHCIQDLLLLLRKITISASQAGARLSVCFSSRQFPFPRVSDCPQIIIQHHNRRDIATYLDGRLCVMDEPLWRALRKKIITKSAGIFFWVALVTDEILRKWEEGYGLRALLAVLDSLPQELEDMFSALLLSLNSDSRQLSCRLFQWAVQATKPLRLHEWQHIYGFIQEPTPLSLREWRSSDKFSETPSTLERVIGNISRGLIGVRTRVEEPRDQDFESMSMHATAGSLLEYGENRVVEVIHESVRQYFLQGNGFRILDPSLIRNPIGDGHRFIMATCLHYINITELDHLSNARSKAADNRSGPDSQTRAQTTGSGLYSARRPYDPPDSNATQEPSERSSALPDSQDVSAYLAHLDVLYQSGKTRSVNVDQWMTNRVGNDLSDSLISRPMSAHSSDTNISLESKPSQLLEDFPALLPYTTSELFTHAQLAEEAGVDPSPNIHLLKESWARWVVLSESLPEGTDLLQFLRDRGLPRWVRCLSGNPVTTPKTPEMSPEPQAVETKRSNNDETDQETVDTSQARSAGYSSSLSTNFVDTIDNSINYGLHDTSSDLTSCTHGRSLPVHTSKYLDAIPEVTGQALEGSILEAQPQDGAQDAQNQGLYDTKTDYSPSETSARPRPQNDSYVTDMASEVFGALNCDGMDKEINKHIAESLPVLLRSFAQKLGHGAQTKLHQDVSYFIHKYRWRIRDAFEDMLPIEDGPEVHPLSSERAPLGQYAIRRIFDEPELEYTADEQEDVAAMDHAEEPVLPGLESFGILNRAENREETEDDTDDDDDDEPELTKPQGQGYREFILKTPEYIWLLACLRNELILTHSHPNMMEEIRHRILRDLPSTYKISRSRPSPRYTAMFQLNWDPLSFVTEQEYDQKPGQALEKAITITGSANDAYAVTTKEYLSQIWPVSGSLVMQLVNDVVSDTKALRAAIDLPDGTNVEARIEGAKLVVTAAGPAESIIETLQQFAWIGAALRSSSFDTGVAVCSPLIRDILPDVSAEPDQEVSARILYEVDFEIAPPTAYDKTPSSGQCWQNMFRNPVRVIGYPILAKHNSGLGLEMPLDIMATLAGSDRVGRFDGKLYIKGFSTMFIAVKLTRDLLIWHYCYNRNGGRISHFDHELHGVDDIDLTHLSTARHVVGWSDKSRYYAGAADARYDIKGSGLPGPSASCLLDKVTISSGSIINIGASFLVGVKDTPKHLTRKAYIPKLRSIYTKYVVLWDEEDKRSWLVNGTSALLHLVQASLEEYRKDDFSRSFLWDSRKMQDPVEDRYKANSASLLLGNPHNWGIEIYPGQVEQFEEETSHIERKDTNTKGADAAELTKKRKKGYYLFQDLVEQHCTVLEQIMDHQEQRAGMNGVNMKVRIRQHLEGWDFFEPATDSNPRPRVATLRALAYGWVDFIHSIGAITLFGRVQVLYPTNSRHILPVRGPTSLYDGGAVVFGHNFTWGYHWKAKGDDLEIGHPPSPQVLGPEGGPSSSETNTTTSSEPESSRTFGSQSPQSREGTATSMISSTSSVVPTPASASVPSSSVPFKNVVSQSTGNDSGSSKDTRTKDTRFRALRRESRRIKKKDDT
ncbi:hypothetical protein QBC37DRAFT_480297 [Rhypophila decipiens]|uniref:Nephrocystin 3-like N-terminal domain-containing protein n=1 Tax=Rhypophila decipiens TaxID=261697 RepID=A0AAN7B8M2_9PEZI|nr:hypothetical protein QBC37DRAFT_480297 [Rhypophila decipiens]